MRVLSADWVLPVAGAPIERGAVAFENGRIAAVGPASELGEGERFADSVIVPGLVNAHTHLAMNLFRGRLVVYRAEVDGVTVVKELESYSTQWAKC